VCLGARFFASVSSSILGEGQRPKTIYN
jgi:hypothetical protein